jgi:hypothetical protein
MGFGNEQIGFGEDWFSGIRNILDYSFIRPKVDHKLNSKIILHEIKNIEFDKEKIVSFIKNLSEDEWTYSYVFNTLKELDNIIKISDEFIKKHAIEELKAKDLLEIKWDIMNNMMLDYAKFSKECYDTLKYSENYKIDKEKRLLMLNIMEAFDKIHKSSKDLVDRFYNKNFNKNSFKKFMETRIAIDHLMLRVNYILLNIENKDKLKKYREILSNEIVEYTIR